MITQQNTELIEMTSVLRMIGNSLCPFLLIFTTFWGNKALASQEINTKIWDTFERKEVVFDTISKQFMHTDGTIPGKKFQNQSMEVLKLLASSKTGLELVEKMEKHQTKIIFDVTDKRTIRKYPENNSTLLRDLNHEGHYLLDENGFCFVVLIVPDFNNIKAGTNGDSLYFLERFLGTITVEYGHFATKEQNLIEDSLINTDIFSSPELFAKVYNPLINASIRTMIRFRNEMGIMTDLTVFKFYTSYASQEIGKFIRLEDDNEKIFIQLKK